MTLDILICTFNKGIVRVADILLPENKNIRYVVSFQYTDERYINLTPEVLKTRNDVLLSTHRGKGLSANRNHALDLATSDLVIFSDDDARFSEEGVGQILKTFHENPDMDIAFFRATTYRGKPFKEYPAESCQLERGKNVYRISILEMVSRRASVQGRLRFDERFGLGAAYLTCGEEEVWMKDAFDMELVMRYFPINIVETSTMLRSKLVYVDATVQRSFGAVAYYLHGKKAGWVCFRYALKTAFSQMGHFIPMLRHMFEGIDYIRKTKKVV